jgi:hypothetical protein
VCAQRVGWAAAGWRAAIRRSERSVLRRARSRAVAAAMAGYYHLRTQATAGTAEALSAAIDKHLQPVMARLDQLEQRTAAVAERRADPPPLDHRGLRSARRRSATRARFSGSSSS